MSTASEHLSVADLARVWAVSTKTIRRLIATREIAAVRIGRQVRISAQQVRAYERAHEFGGRA